VISDGKAKMELIEPFVSLAKEKRASQRSAKEGEKEKWRKSILERRNLYDEEKI